MESSGMGTHYIQRRRKEKNVMTCFCHKVVLFFFFLIFIFIYLFIYSWLCWVFVSVRGLSPVAVSGGHSSLQCMGLSLSRPLPLGAQAPDAQAQHLWLTGPAALRHAGSPRTRARTRVPCIGRQTLNRCATREAQFLVYL